MGDLTRARKAPNYSELWRAPIFWTTYIDQCIRGIFPSERKVVLVHGRPMAILTSLLKAVSLLEDVQNYAIAYGSEILGYFPCRVAHPITVQQNTQASNTETCSVAGLLLIESPSDMVENHGSKIAWETMDMFSGRPLQIHEANIY